MNKIKLASWLYRTAIATEARLYGFQKHRIHALDTDIHFYTNGIQEQRKTVVLLHGFSADKSLWLRCAKYFGASYNIIIPDLAGHGENRFDATLSYSMASQAKRVVALLDRFHINQCVVAGNSMGGFLSAYLARYYPQRITAAALLDPAGVATPVKSEFEERLAQGENRFLIDNREQFDQFYPMTMHRPPYIPSLIQHAVAFSYQRRKAQLAKIFADYHCHDTLDNELAAISTPVLILWGRHDRLIDVSGADVWHEGIKDSELYVFDDLGHMPMVEAPRRTAQFLKDFFAKHA
ncbi:alpha/beta fold hydrolase [Aestuariibacter salexigens]|uniref:alpha/beta fold hydrolase n=1 Tax=Aestuariibacter salexigens TaxID=226010 RepID=UPI00040F26EC|nr:alpha/beta hydrolase [Aestuariibacter salexigens]